MSVPARHALPPSLQDLAAMAALLERLEGTPHRARAASAAQYREVVQQLGALLARAEPGAALDAVLAAAPATAQLYENLQYAHAGLCRSPLDQALGAELAASAAIEKARRAGPSA
jgi:hypothetical protein